MLLTSNRHISVCQSSTTGSSASSLSSAKAASLLCLWEFRARSHVSWSPPMSNLCAKCLCCVSPSTTLIGTYWWQCSIISIISLPTFSFLRITPRGSYNILGKVSLTFMTIISPPPEFLPACPHSLVHNTLQYIVP